MPSNLRDTTDLEQFTQEVRLTSDNDSAFQWLVGAFYSDVKRNYAQRLPTPGYDAMTDAALGAGTSAAVANGIPDPDSPYKADVPYDINQWAVFGDVSYDLTERFTLSAGARYHDYEEARSFRSGGLFANLDNETGGTTSTGWDTRFIASYEMSEDVNVNLQASEGFRPGGINDPLNIPLCTPADAATFGPFPKNYRDENGLELRGGRQGRALQFHHERGRLLQRHHRSSGELRRGLVFVALGRQRAQGACRGPRARGGLAADGAARSSRSPAVSSRRSSTRRSLPPQAS